MSEFWKILFCNSLEKTAYIQIILPLIYVVGNSAEMYVSFQGFFIGGYIFKHKLYNYDNRMMSLVAL